MINNSLTDFEELTCTIFYNALNALDFAKHIDARIECTWLCQAYWRTQRIVHYMHWSACSANLVL